jgi:triacylglycerol esterase/lipase EstA (alpha/beta hydrolase family)
VTMGGVLRSLLLAAATALLVAAPASAASPYAPLTRKGPKLSVSSKLLKGSLKCTKNVRNAPREPVLLLPATGVNSDQNFSWNYQRAFDKTGVPYCTSNQPGKRNGNLGDIQVRGQYVTYAIRRVHQLAGRRIAVMGHSQGGMVMRWSLRFWPDTRKDVKDVIGMAGSNHGTIDARLECGVQKSCTPADWQQSDTANFIKALNSGSETFKNIAYTEIYTHTDEVVEPNQDDSGSSSMHNGPGLIANVATQEICPADTAEHLGVGTYDNVAYSLAIDALTHNGPAKKSRIPLTVCAQPFQPGVNPATFATDAGGAAVALESSSYTKIPAEPKLACYVPRVSRCHKAKKK